MIGKLRFTLLAATFLMGSATTHAAQMDWQKLDAETLRHFQALVRFDTSDPPGNEKPLSDYLVGVLKDAGIPVETFALEAHRPNVVARLKGNGKKRPLLIMAHQDVVNVDPAKWKFPPFSATRDGGWIYGRGTVDDKDNVVAGLMIMLLLKRNNIALDRDVIFLAESGEEGATHVGIEFMIKQHFKEIDAEYCLAEGGNVVRRDSKVVFSSVETTEKLPRAIQMTGRGIAGHGSVPLQSNSIVRLSNAIAKVAAWQAPVRLGETTAAYFEALAGISKPADAERYRALLKPDTKEGAAAFEYMLANEPRHASMLHTSISPNMVNGGYRINIIPSEAKAMLDVRLLPDENPEQLLESVRKVVDDPAVEVAWAPRNERPGASARLSTEAYQAIEATFKDHYKAAVLPTMSTGATDMAYLRAKGVQCYGIGVAMDEEDGPKGFGAHSDQERVIESELYRFVRAHWDVVVKLAQAR